MVPSSRKGLTGLESAIILVAFVITAAAFSFVVLNMGFLTSQTSRSIISSSISESSTSLQCDGEVVGHFNTTSSQMIGVIFYIKLSGGSSPVSMDNNKLTITYSNVRVSGVLYGSLVSNDTVCTLTQVEGNGDKILSQGETWKIMCNFAKVGDDPDTGLTIPSAYALAYESFSIAVRPANGAILTITRNVPGDIENYKVIDN
jgi:flagellin FlaB